MSEEALEDAPAAADAQTEEPGGSEHFLIGDAPPGADSGEPEPVATEPDSTSVEEVDATVATPLETFWSFKTADGQEKSFSSQEEAQQFFSSWNGRLSKAERELGEVTQLNMDWQNSYRKGELGREEPSTPDSEKLVEAAKDADSKGALSAQDWKNVSDYIKENKGQMALQYINWRNDEYLKDQVEGIKADVKQQFEDLAAPAQFQSEVAGAMTYVAQAGQAAVNDMGEPMFPEFQDGEGYNQPFVKHFREIWLNQDYKMATDPSGTGFKAAYYEAKATYRAPEELATGKASDFIAPATPGEAVAAAVPPRNADGTFAKRSAALAMSDTPDVPSSGKPTGPGNKQQDILSAMRDVGTSRSEHFAVAPD